MGSNANAGIIYGFLFEECYSHDVETWLAMHQGLPKPEGEWDDNPEAHRAYYEARKTLPIDTDCQGDMMSDVVRTYLIIKESRFNGMKIPVDHVRTPPPEWDELLRAFCEKSGVPFQQPDWYLIASYG